MMWVVLGHLYLWPTQYVGYSNEQDILPPTGLMATYSGTYSKLITANLSQIKGLD